MHRFWDSIIEPVLEALQPRSLVEIGSDKGFNTQNLLEFCQRSDAKLHVVDPLPKYDVAAWQERYGEHVAFHLCLSLNAILLIDRFDMVLIDGDHNWYTVLNELKLIEKQCNELSQPFPLVFMHDIGWPYGRRDLYYKPETIPGAYRRPFRQKGMHPESAELLEEGGLNQHLFNAIHENNLQSGVLTAIEDFLEETEQQLKLVKIPGIHGLGMLVPLHLEEQNEELTKLLKALDFSPIGRRHIERVERIRLETEIRREEDHAALRAKEAEAKELLQQLADKDRQLEALESERRQQLADKNRLEEVVRSKDRKLAELNRKAKQRSQEVETLERWVEELNAGISAVLNSRRWKVSNLLGNLLQRLLLRPRVPMAVDAISEVNKNFRAWKRDRMGQPGKNGSRPRPQESSSGKPAAHTSIGSAGPEKRERTKVSVLAWDLGHNPIGRAYLLAEALGRKFDVEIVGAKFPNYGTEVWGPLRDSEIPVVDFIGQDFPAHFSEMERLAREIDGDVILVSKPRLPSYELGILAKQFENRLLILDVDDYELSFFQERESLTLKDAGELQRDRGFLVPHAGLWTRYCEGTIPLADGLTVSNAELQKRYGGKIVPHARDEKTFDPALYDRDSIRARFGFTPEDRVILFIGTVRPHKGVVKIAEALEKIGNPRYKLCVIGTVKGRNLRARLEGLEGDHVRLFDDQPYQNLPANLVIGDLVCLLQDPESEISKYQMPAKFTDALAMGIPMLATDAPPLRHLVSEGLVEPLGEASLDQKIEEMFANYAEFKEKALKNTKVFRADYSYAAVVETLEELISSLLHEPPPLPKEFKRLVRFHRQIFSSPPSGSREKPEVVRSGSLAQTPPGDRATPGGVDG